MQLFAYLPRPGSEDGEAVRATRTVEELVEAMGTDSVDERFSEVELGAEQQRFGDVAHVFSACAGSRRRRV